MGEEVGKGTRAGARDWVHGGVHGGVARCNAHPTLQLYVSEVAAPCTQVLLCVKGALQATLPKAYRQSRAANHLLLGNCWIR